MTKIDTPILAKDGTGIAAAVASLGAVAVILHNVLPHAHWVVVRKELGRSFLVEVDLAKTLY